MILAVFLGEAHLANLHTCRNHAKQLASACLLLDALACNAAAAVPEIPRGSITERGSVSLAQDSWENAVHGCLDWCTANEAP